MRNLISILIVCMPLMAKAAEVQLVDSISVRGPTIQLGEIASIKAKDTAEHDALAKVEIAPVPNIGGSLTLSSFAVKAALQKAGFGEVAVLGQRSTITTESRTFTEDELREAVQSWAASQKNPSEDTEVQIGHLPVGWVVPAAKELHVVVELGNHAFCGALTLTLNAVSEDQVVGSQRAQITVRRFAQVPVMVRPLQSGEALTADHIAMQRAEITQATGMEIPDIKSEVGYVAKYNLAVGARPKITDFERPLLVQRGQPSQIVVENGAVHLRVSGAIALENGREGDLVSFSDPMNTRETLKARVLKSGVAVMKIN